MLFSLGAHGTWLGYWAGPVLLVWVPLIHVGTRPCSCHTGPVFPPNGYGMGSSTHSTGQAASLAISDVFMAEGWGGASHVGGMSPSSSWAPS